MANELRGIYGEACRASLVTVQVFGHRFPFLRAGANALLRAAMDAYDTGHEVYSIWAYNCRRVTGGTSWSAHAWGAAVDIDPERNPYSSRGRLITDLPPPFVQAFLRQGFGWGGNWRTIKDPMHFSLAPSEQGRAVREAYDPDLQARADARWAGRRPKPPPEPRRPGRPAPPWEHEHPGYVRRPHPECETVRRWQRQMADRGWDIEVDGVYGKGSETVCQAFQREKALRVDGILGPETWRCAWECPVT